MRSNLIGDDNDTYVGSQAFLYKFVMKFFSLIWQSLFVFILVENSEAGFSSTIPSCGFVRPGN